MARPADANAPVAAPASLPLMNAGFCAPPGEKLLGYARPALDPDGRTLPASARAALRDFARAKGKSESAAALARAYEAAPNDPAIALAFAHSVLHTLRADRARQALDTYLRAHPKDIASARLRARLGTQHEIEAEHRTVEEGGLALRYPADLLDEGKARALLASVGGALREAAALTDTEQRAQLLTIVYRDRSELLAVTCTPMWAAGVYDGTLRLVFDPSGDGETMRHEALHAQLGPLLPPQPLWFHEGLAQYFAASGRFRFGRGHRLMLENRTYIPFSSLEGSFFVFDGNADASLAYEQSVAMIHVLVDTLGTSAIPRAVARLRSHPREPNLVAALATPGHIDEHTLLTWLQSKQQESP